MWELGCEKAECWRIDAFELWCWRRFLRVPWTARRSNQSIPKEISRQIFTGRTGAEAEAPILWPSDAKNWLVRKDPDAGKCWRQDKQMTEDEMVGWHHWLNEHESEQTPGDSEGRVSLEYCSSWVREQSDTTEWLSMGTSTKEIIEKWFIFSFSIGLGA